MKYNYTEPEMNILWIEQEDIITTSPPTPETELPPDDVW